MCIVITELSLSRQQNVGPESPSSAAGQQDDLHYASISFFQKQGDVVYSNIRVHHQTETEEEVEYSVVRFDKSSSESGWAASLIFILTLKKTMRIRLKTIRVNGLFFSSQSTMSRRIRFICTVQHGQQSQTTDKTIKHTKFITNIKTSFIVLQVLSTITLKYVMRQYLISCF